MLKIKIKRRTVYDDQGEKSLLNMRKTLIGRINFCTIVLSIFSFLLGCMFTINLTPIDKACRIEHTGKVDRLTTNTKKNIDLIILILSAPNNLDKRMTIRETWLKLYETDDQNDFKMRHYFVIGSLDLSADQLLHISSEQSRFNDILILPLHDSYKNLTEKVKSSFEWLNKRNEFKYVLKCDDDSFVNLKMLIPELASIEQLYLKPGIQSTLTMNVPNQFISINAQVNKNMRKNNLQLYWGYFSGNARIKVKGKWKEIGWFVSDRYIPYALGGGYVVSKDLVNYIANNSNNLRSFTSEDVSIGFWLAPLNNILRIHDTRFDTEWISRGCQNSHIVTHNIPPEDMRQMYKNLKDWKVLCTKETHKRNYYIYDWSVPPSQCCKPLSIIRLKN